MDSSIKAHVSSCILLILLIFRSSTQEEIQVSNPQCEAAGTKHVSISWIPNATGNYSAYFCQLPSPSLCQNVTEFQFGCRPLGPAILGRKQDCNIGHAAVFDSLGAFNYAIGADVGGETHFSLIARCPLSLIIKCNQMTGLILKPVKKRVLRLSWDKPDMGLMSNQLCYRISYYSLVHGVAKNQTPVTQIIQDSFSFHPVLLLPFTKYGVYVQCALNCVKGWGQQAGPIFATTPEEAPELPLVFDSPDEKVINKDERDININIKFPPETSWNGIVQQVKLMYWELMHNISSNTTVTRVNFTGLKTHTQSIYLPSLGLNKWYKVKGVFCTSVGCSPASNELTIPAQAGRKITEQFLIEPDSAVYWYIGIGCGVSVLIAAICLSVICTRYHATGNPRIPLEERVGHPIEPLVLEEPSVSDTVEYDNLDISAVSATSLSRSVFTADASSIASHLTMDQLNCEARDFSTASVRTLRSSNSLPCMESSTMVDVDLNVISEEEGQATSVVEPSETVLTSSNDIELPLIREDRTGV